MSVFSWLNGFGAVVVLSVALMATGTKGCGSTGYRCENSTSCCEHHFCIPARGGSICSPSEPNPQYPEGPREGPAMPLSPPPTPPPQPVSGNCRQTGQGCVDNKQCCAHHYCIHSRMGKICSPAEPGPEGPRMPPAPTDAPEPVPTDEAVKTSAFVELVE